MASSANAMFETKASLKSFVTTESHLDIFLLCYNGVRLYHRSKCCMLARVRPPQETMTFALFTHSCAGGTHSSRKKRTGGILTCVLWHSHQLAALEDREDLQTPALLTPEWGALSLTLKLPRPHLPLLSMMLFFLLPLLTLSWPCASQMALKRTS